MAVPSPMLRRPGFAGRGAGKRCSGSVEAARRAGISHRGEHAGRAREMLVVRMRRRGRLPLATRSAKCRCTEGPPPDDGLSPPLHPLLMQRASPGTRRAGSAYGPTRTIRTPGPFATATAGGGERCIDRLRRCVCGCVRDRLAGGRQRGLGVAGYPRRSRDAQLRDRGGDSQRASVGIPEVARAPGARGHDRPRSQRRPADWSTP
jgi:hypothetical protein